MDWLAGSRQHVLEIVFTRVCVLAPLFVIGFSEGVINAYILVVGFQAVLNHANVHLPWGPLKYLIVTPDFHHWHHSSDDEAIDRNYAAHYSFLDYLFGTAVKVPAHKPLPENTASSAITCPTAGSRSRVFRSAQNRLLDDLHSARGTCSAGYRPLSTPKRFPT
jgi:sterol desaturase/sphingolipid hydroxylase (fatty acid hydroxylase superfamily)